jgi:hypothetical protein
MTDVAYVVGAPKIPIPEMRTFSGPAPAKTVYTTSGIPVSSLTSESRIVVRASAAGPQYGAIMRWLALISLCLIVAGLVVGIASPGAVTGALFPIGLTLWWAVGALARRQDIVS